MYVRFESSTPCATSRGRLGIFNTALDLWWDHGLFSDAWQYSELRRLLDWFDRHLDTPGRFAFRARRKDSLQGDCWFRDSARVHITRAHYMKWLLEDLGIPIRMRVSTNPGCIFWADDHQVVVLRDMR